MKLFAPVLLGLSHAGENRATVQMAREVFGNDSHVCGMISGESGHMAETMSLDAGESCIYRIKPNRDVPENSHFHIRLIEAAEVDCSEVQLHVVTDGQVMGPYCYDTQEDGSRHRRGAYSSNSGMDFASKEVDMVYSRTQGGGFRFAFNFEFEFELLPGLPSGGYQEGFKENLGAYGEHAKPSKPAYSKPAYGKPAEKPAYGKPADKPAYGKPADKPAYGKPSKPYGADNTKPAPQPTKPAPTQAPYKPKPTTQKPYKPTQAPYKPKPTTQKPKPTQAPYKPKPTTQKPYKPTTEKPTTQKPYKPTTEKPTTQKPTTQKPYKPTTEKPTTQKPYKPPTTPKPTTQKPYKPKPTKPSKPIYGPGDKPPMYKPNASCPWETNHGFATYAGDCPGFKNKCNLKYFKVCGESFFNKVYNDVCKWQDAKQLIPMFTQKLVPLGAAFEAQFGVKCDGLNYQSKSIDELNGGELPRDVPLCKPSAGAVPCDLINFHGVTTARQFHLKVETLYHEYLIDHCNKEWQVHFEALLIRMRGSLFCDDGSSPDHAGYVVSPPPPVYGSTPAPPTNPPQTPYNPPNPPKPPKPTQYNPPNPPKPPKPTQYNPPNPPKPPKPTQYSGNNNTPRPGKPYKPPVFKPAASCPWDQQSNNVASYGGDCPGHNGLCNLKYFKVCGETFFNKVYNDVCHWQDAAQLIPMITQKLVPLGAKFENVNSVTCNGLNKEGKSIQILLGGELKENDRDVPQCKAAAGAVPCQYIDFTGITNARQFHYRIEDLYHSFLKQHCNKEWQVHFEALLVRMRNSLFCDDGGMPDHEGYVVSPPPPVYVPTQAPTTQAPKPKPTQKPKPKPSSATYAVQPAVQHGNQYTSNEGPFPTAWYCPWNGHNYNNGAYKADCKNGKCSLKHSTQCIRNLFNKVYANICAWQEAIKLVTDITGFLRALGVNYANNQGDDCMTTVNAYKSKQRGLFFGFGEEPLEEEYATAITYEDTRRRREVREVPSCALRAGVIDCGKYNFHQAKNELEFYFMIKQLVDDVGANGCNGEWRRKMASFVLRLKNSLTCEGGLQPDH